MPPPGRLFGLRVWIPPVSNVAFVPTVAVSDDCAWKAVLFVWICPARAAKVLTDCWATFARANVCPTGCTAVNATV